MEPILDAFEQVASQVRFKAPRIPLLSNLTGRALEEGEIPDAHYWRRHIREAVRFAAGIHTLSAMGYELFLELGPTPTLLSMGKACLPRGAGTWLPSLKKGRDDWQCLLDSLATLYTCGAEVNWAGFDRDYQRHRLALGAFDGAVRGNDQYICPPLSSRSPRPRVCGIASYGLYRDGPRCRSGGF